MYISASIDNSGTGNLLDKLESFADKTFSTVFDATTDLLDDVREIMYRWADVESVPSNSRGSFVDGQELAFLEKLMGQPFTQGGAPNPYGPGGGNLINEAFHIAINNIYARLVAQTAAGELFEGDWSYNPVTDEFDGITGLVQSKLDALETEAAGLANTAARETFWSNVLRMIEYSVGVSNLPGGDQTALNTAIEDSDSALDLGNLLSGLEFSVSSGITNNGTSGNDTINGGTGNDYLAGQAGTDTINGGSGHDTIQGGNDADSLTGNSGGDYVIGNSGNDTYYYNSGDGSDTIDDRGNTGDTDIIQLGTGIDSGDLTFSRIGESSLFILINDGVNTGQIMIENHFGNFTYGRIETIRFFDTSTIDLTTKVFTTYGTSANDSINGIVTGGSTTDTIYLYAGDDTSSAGAGDDIVYGGDGNDTIYGDNDNDTLYGDNGSDTLTGGAGNDILYGGAGNDKLYGNAGNDYYYYDGGDDTFLEGNGGAGADEIRLANGIDLADLTFSRQGSYDLRIDIDGGGSITVKDQFYYSGGSAPYIIETIRFFNNTTLTLTSQAYTTYGTAGNDSIGGIVYGGLNTDTIYGQAGADTISAGDGNDVVYGGEGNDTIYGEAGADTLSGEGGNDTVYGGAGNDIYYYSTGDDILAEGSSSPGGTDEIRLRDGISSGDLTFNRSGNNAVILIAGGGSITIESYFSSSSYIIETIRFYNNSTLDPTLQTYTTYGTASNDTIYGITAGGSINETIYGLDGGDTLSAGTGNDIIYGGNGNDYLYGGAGTDIMSGDAGNDYMEDSGGNDTYIYSGGLDTIYDSASSTDTLILTHSATINDISFSNVGSYDIKLVAASGTDELTFLWWRWSATYQVENIEFSDGFKTTLNDYASWQTGTTGNDTLNGTASHNTLIGKAGDDTISAGAGADDAHGGDGADILWGGDGNDLLHGGAGNDVLHGQSNLDTLYGGAGADTFAFETVNAFSAVDVIKDFNTGQGDIIDVSDILSSYDPLMHLITDWIEITTSGANSVVKVDRDGTGSTYSLTQIATIEGVTGLTDEAALVTSGNLVV